MKTPNLGQTISTLANLGVIAGIIFLALELQQNNQLLRAEAIGAVLETRLNRQDLVLQGVDVAALIERNRTSDVLSPEDLERIRALRSSGFIGWQRDYFLFQEGILTEEYFRANFPVMKNAMTNEEGAYSGREHWESWSATSASPAYRSFVERCILSDCEEIPR